jgi:S-DNA-T family DNA segregation ATPase FtsK/SpoIIIE
VKYEEYIKKLDNLNEEFDELLPQAVEIAVEIGQASISLLQRRLRVGYNRAARLIDAMEERGIIGGYEGSKPRQVLISKEELEGMF